MRHGDTGLSQFRHGSSGNLVAWNRWRQGFLRDGSDDRWSFCKKQMATIKYRKKRRRALLRSNPPRNIPVSDAPKALRGPSLRHLWRRAGFFSAPTDSTTFGHRSHPLKTSAHRPLATKFREEPSAIGLHSSQASTAVRPSRRRVSRRSGRRGSGTGSR